MANPEAVRWRARKVGLDLSLRSSGVARETTRRSAAVLRVTERMPSVANWMKMWPRSGAMNCGMKERKKRAVLGLRASVRMPWRKALAVGEEPCLAVLSGNEVLRERIMRMPRKTRYAAPAYLTVWKATAEAARIAEIPRAAAKTWKSPPKKVPKAD